MVLDSKEQQEILLKIIGLVGISGNVEEVKKTLSVFEQLAQAIQTADINGKPAKKT